MNPPPLAPEVLLDAFALERHRYVYIIGGGGKTSLMLALAGAMAAHGRSVITTTSTKMLVPSAADADEVIVQDDPAALAEWLAKRPAGPTHTFVGKRLLDGGVKVGGFAVAELENLRAAAHADCWLVEGDGSAGRSLKAHADYEPVVSPDADLVIAVVGVDCIGGPATDANVHRADRFRSLLNRGADGPVTSVDVANIILHPRGYLAQVSPRSAVTVFISKAGPELERRTARRLAQELYSADGGGRIERIVIGELNHRLPFVEVFDCTMSR